MRPAHPVFVPATGESSGFLLRRTAVNSIPLTHGGPQSPADNERGKMHIAEKGINHGNLHKPLSYMLILQIIHNVVPVLELRR